MTMRLSAALTMSYTVSAATDTACSASISTPVGPFVFTVAEISKPQARGVRVTSTLERANGWHIGIASAVRFAAWMPAMRATASTGPFSRECSRTRAIAAFMPCESIVFVFGCAADKDIDGMLREVASAADKVIFTRVPGSTRAADPKDLQRRYSETGKMSQVAEDIPSALNQAARAVNREDLICVTGSLYLVAEVKKYLATLASKK